MSDNPTSSDFAPPPHPPPPHPLNLPFLHDQDNQLYSARGYTAIDLSSLVTPTLTSLNITANDLFTRVFASSAKFFETSKERKSEFDFTAKELSEHGWSEVKGEKELLTLRSKETTPSEVLEDAELVWKVCGEICDQFISAVERSLDLPDGSLKDLASPNFNLPDTNENRVATLLRMFRYERSMPPSLTDEEKKALDDHDGSLPVKRVVAFPHKDLGLLSLVIGSSPGLEVWDPILQSWVSIEESPLDEEGKPIQPQPRITASILTGTFLTHLTNGVYFPGIHRVVVPVLLPSSPSNESPYRYSVVYPLRAHSPVILNASVFATPLTGIFKPERIALFDGKTAGEVYDKIAGKAWNINTEKNSKGMQMRNERGAFRKLPPKRQGTMVDYGGERMG
jgi:isopenicillin N synthase-like dioxygenase